MMVSVSCSPLGREAFILGTSSVALPPTLLIMNMNTATEKVRARDETMVVTIAMDTPR